MLTVKTVLKPSEVGGLGIFADEKIPKGTVVWKFDARFDLFFEPSEVERMETLQKEFILKYAYLSSQSGKFVFCIDDARFMNHSATHSNLDTVFFEGEPESRDIASRDIAHGEELLINYRSFDAADAVSAAEYLKS